MNTGRILPRIVIFIAVLVTGVLVLSFFSIRKEPIREGEVGVVEKRDGSFRFYQPGDRPFLIPFLQKLTVISTRPQTVIFKEEEGFKIKRPEGEMQIDVRVVYFIKDLESALTSFGVMEPHREIRELLRKTLTELLNERFSEEAYEGRKRHLLIAELHLTLNEIFSNKGVAITSFEVRF